MEEYVELIKKHPIFEGITQDDDILWLRKCMDAKIETYKRGETIFREGDELPFASIILEGKALAVAPGGTISVLGFGDCMFDSMPSGRSLYASYTLLADEDLTVFSMRVLRLVKLCSFRCVFHAKLLENLEKKFS